MCLDVCVEMPEVWVGVCEGMHEICFLICVWGWDVCAGVCVVRKHEVCVWMCVAMEEVCAGVCVGIHEVCVCGYGWRDACSVCLDGFPVLLMHKVYLGVCVKGLYEVHVLRSIIKGNMAEKPNVCPLKYINN